MPKHFKSWTNFILKCESSNTRLSCLSDITVKTSFFCQFDLCSFSNPRKKPGIEQTEMTSLNTKYCKPHCPSKTDFLSTVIKQFLTVQVFTWGLRMFGIRASSHSRHSSRHPPCWRQKGGGEMQVTHETCFQYFSLWKK